MKEEFKSVKYRLNEALINSSGDEEIDELFQDLVQEKVDEKISELFLRVILFIMCLLFFAGSIFFHYLPKEKRSELHKHIDNIYKSLE